MNNNVDHSSSSNESHDNLDLELSLSHHPSSANASHDNLDLELSLSQPEPRPQPQPQSQPQPQPDPPLLQETNFQSLPPNTNTSIIPWQNQPYSIMQQPEPPYVLVPSQVYGITIPELYLQLIGNQDQEQEPKTETITPPYQWATSKRAKIFSLDHLLSHNITTITGTAQCKKCKRKHELGFNLQEKFDEVKRFIEENNVIMNGKATQSWIKPLLPTCNNCGRENSMKPVITKKRKINWLFLFLGQMIGCCTNLHLKYFCKHNNYLRNAAKDRLIYVIYMDLCKQLSEEAAI